MGNRTFILVDGKNLVLRYQSSLNGGAQNTEDTVHVQDVLVWHPKITTYVPINKCNPCILLYNPSWRQTYN